MRSGKLPGGKRGKREMYFEAPQDLEWRPPLSFCIVLTKSLTWSPYLREVSFPFEKRGK